ncbi:hypothetical protein HYPSUDRAFT_220837 [Hypholoma sublateritium FD-334 SS-4]|uniref:Uncharacterized protein n=1 Tax=Hypholoma sublateritium (strain FD-334 SS-4) TaxID=945553 RepID=A0A0D2NYR4_HYPSF|nr:hypothetical protein HYPSUDRAFT_220837 [Hypholoma sublateritium FD-334 SS-4]
MSESSTNHFHRMPENVLCQIFEVAVGHSPIILLPMQTFNSIQYNLLLVCKKWNSLAVGIPSMWVSFKFELEAISTPPLVTQTLLRQFSICLQRSQNSLVTIVFSSNSGGWRFTNVNSILARCYSRTKSLTCTLRSGRDVDAFLSLPPGTFPGLQYININFVNTTSGIAHASARSVPARAFEGAPSLKTAILHRIHGLNHMKLRLPWGELTYLDLGGTPMLPHTFIRIMRYTSHTLQTAFIFVEVDDPLDTALKALTNAISFQNLTTLRLRLAHLHHDWRILSILHVPYLVTLRLEMFSTPQHWDISSIARFIEPSSQSLQQLHLSDFRPDRHSLVRTHQNTTHTVLRDLFNLIPKIDTLRLPISIIVHATTIESIASGKILKNLTTFELSYANIWHALALSNHHNVVSLRSISIHPPSALIQEIMQHPTTHLQAQVPMLGEADTVTSRANDVFANPTCERTGVDIGGGRTTGRTHCAKCRRMLEELS